MIDGRVAPGFALVAEAFEANFRERDELGASFAATLDGRPIVDLWGGVADLATGRPWTSDTLQVIFSGTKGITGLSMLMLVDRGQLDLEVPVATYWPEFAAHGKDDITVGEMMSHQAGLPGVEAELAEEDVPDARRIARLLADQVPEPQRREHPGYHALTYGWLCGELLRRIDGRAIGRFVAEEIAKPLDLELWLGLPKRLERRVSVVVYGPNWWEWLESFPMDDYTHRIWFNPPLFSLERMPWNLTSWHAAELACSGAITTSRSLARLYGCLARGGELDGVRLLSPQTLALGRERRIDTRDPVTKAPMSYGAGLELQTVAQPFGWPVEAFGYSGAGGSVHGVWPRERIAFSYAMNELRNEPDGDPRARALLDALHRSIRAQPEHPEGAELMTVADALRLAGGRR